jgi:Protein of unknown function (DUF1579)
MTLRRSILLGSALVIGMSCLAQQTKKTDGKAAKTEQKKEQPAGAMQMPKASPELVKAQKALVGSWKLTGKIQDEHWAPGGASGTGMETVRKGPGGFSIISDSKMNWGKMGPMQGHGVISWDDHKKAFTGLWCDNWAPQCEPLGDGKWQGDSLVFEGDMDMGPAKVPVRMTYSNISANGYDWKMEIGDGKGGWNPEMSLKYEKAGAAPAKEKPGA